MNALDREMAKLAAMGITISTKLAPGSPADSPAALIQEAAERAGIAEPKKENNE